MRNNILAHSFFFWVYKIIHIYTSSYKFLILMIFIDFIIFLYVFRDHAIIFVRLHHVGMQLLGFGRGDHCMWENASQLSTYHETSL